MRKENNYTKILTLVARWQEMIGRLEFDTDNPEYIEDEELAIILDPRFDEESGRLNLYITANVTGESRNSLEGVCIRLLPQPQQEENMTHSGYLNSYNQLVLENLAKGRYRIKIDQGKLLPIKEKTPITRKSGYTHIQMPSLPGKRPVAASGTQQNWSHKYSNADGTLLCTLFKEGKNQLMVKFEAKNPLWSEKIVEFKWQLQSNENKEGAIDNLDIVLIPIEWDEKTQFCHATIDLGESPVSITPWLPNEPLSLEELTDDDKDLIIRSVALGTKQTQQIWRHIKETILTLTLTQKEAIDEGLKNHPGQYQRIEGLKKDLLDDNWSTRAAAIEKMGLLGDRRVTELLIKVLAQDNDSMVRVAAADALGHLGDRSAISQLQKSLNDKDQAVKRASERGLAKITINDRKD